MDVFEHLDIYDPRERALVGLADLALRAGAWPLGLLRRRPARDPQRILLLRLERIGDLLMSLGAIRAVRALAPHAVIDLVVGGWNEPIARMIPGIDRIQTLDAPWLARGAASSAVRLVREAANWRRQHYDLAINFEADIRSHVLMAASLAPCRVGFDTGGGGPVLTDRVRHDPTRHIADNALWLVERAFGLAPGSLPGPFDAEGAAGWRLSMSADDRATAAAWLEAHGVAGDVRRRVIAVHIPGGREIKQWPPERFADVARTLALEHDATVLFTGGAADRALIEAAAREIGADAHVVAAAGDLDLRQLAAVLSHAALLVTGDTGPMHLAAAVGTPIVAVFGPSKPVRYGPLLAGARVVRIDLACSPCNRIRRPPARCVGHTPDCLSGIDVAAVLDAARALLGRPVTLGLRSR